MNIVCLHLEKFGILHHHGPFLAAIIQVLVIVIITIQDLRLCVSRRCELLHLTLSVLLKVMA